MDSTLSVLRLRNPVQRSTSGQKFQQGYTSADFCEKLIEEQGIVVTPGSGFGDEGEGYFRISITIKEERIAEAIERLKMVHF